MRHPERHIGKTLKAERERLGLNAESVAKRCNVSRSRIYQWDKEQFILPKNLRALASALDIPHSVLIALNGQRLKKISRCPKLDVPLAAIAEWALICAWHV